MLPGSLLLVILAATGVATGPDGGPTRTSYDALDRATRVVLPDGSATKMAYTLANHDGRRRLSTLIEDANGNQRQTFRDVRGLVTAVRELDGGLPIVTRYAHDHYSGCIASSTRREM